MPRVWQNVWNSGRCMCVSNSAQRTQTLNGRKSISNDIRTIGPRLVEVASYVARFGVLKYLSLVSDLSCLDTTGNENIPLARYFSHVLFTLIPLPRTCQLLITDKFNRMQTWWCVGCGDRTHCCLWGNTVVQLGERGSEVCYTHNRCKLSENSTLRRLVYRIEAPNLVWVFRFKLSVKQY